MNPQRYLSAIVRAAIWTLRGKRPPPPRQPRVHMWARETALIVAQTLAAAEASGLRQSERQAVTVRVDKRMLTLENALQTIRHHAAREYPYLLKHYDRFSIMTIQATNLNDLHVTRRLSELSELPAALRQRLSQLHEHLGALPPADPDPQSPS